MSAPKGVTGLVACDEDDSAEEVELVGEVLLCVTIAPRIATTCKPQILHKDGIRQIADTAKSSQSMG